MLALRNANKRLACPREPKIHSDLPWPARQSWPQGGAGSSPTAAWTTSVSHGAQRSAAGWRKTEGEDQHPVLPQHAYHLTKLLLPSTSAGVSSAMPEKQTAAAVPCPGRQQPPCRARRSRDRQRVSIWPWSPAVAGGEGAPHFFLPPWLQRAGHREAEQGRVLCWHAAASAATAGTWLERGDVNTSWRERRLFGHHTAALCSLCCS